MILLTKLNQTPFTINAVYIERVEATPDTVVTLVSGKKIHVLEPVTEVMDKVTAYYQQISILTTIHKPGPMD